jgi:Ca-activated chloride channel family protein
MNDEELKQFFDKMGVPVPDSERKKEALNMAVAAFEAQKSANIPNNSKNHQGLGWLSRLISQTTSERKDTMQTSNKKYIYGGLATACIALMVGANYIVTQSTRSGGGSTEVAQTLAENEAKEEMQIATAEEALRSSGSVMPIPVEPPKGALPLPAESYAMADAAAPAVQTRAAKMAPQSMVGGGAANMVMGYDGGVFAPQMEIEGRDKFSHDEENAVKQVKAEPVSTFSIDVDTASYAFVRQSLDNGVLPQKDAVRIEEMVNYFDYAYPKPESKDEPFKSTVVVKDSPWNAGKKLMTVGIKGFDVEKTSAPDSNLVFLIDTSGSMNEPNKLPLLKQSFSMLLDSLKPTDKVSIVVYAGSAGTVLQPTEVSKKNEILQALQNLSAGGSTAGGEGIRLAYELAQQNFDKDAVNRVMLATDGDFNVGITEPNELEGFIERMREKGIFLSVIGFGTGNYNDALMQKLAQNGNGVAAYIDTLNEARKVLVEEAGATLFPIAKDVKIQVEFNPSAVSEYRLVGYETRALATEDFNNDKVDAGDIGAGAEVTAVYEFTPLGSTPLVDESRYAPKTEEKKDVSDEIAFVKIRYKLPEQSTSKLITTPVTEDNEKADAAVLRETNWAEAVAGFAQLLKGGKFTGTLIYDDVLKAANENKGDDPFGYRSEFINLVYKAKTAAAMPAQSDGGQGGEYPVPQPMPYYQTR